MINTLLSAIQEHFSDEEHSKVRQGEWKYRIRDIKSHMDLLRWYAKEAMHINSKLTKYQEAMIDARYVCMSIWIYVINLFIIYNYSYQ